MFCTTVGQARRHTARPMGPSTSERSNCDRLGTVAAGAGDGAPVTSRAAAAAGADGVGSIPDSIGYGAADRERARRWNLLERLARGRVARLEAAAGPADALFGRAVRELLGHHAPGGEPLQAIVANRAGGAQPFLDIARLQLDLAGRRSSRPGCIVSPDAGIAVGLQLEPDRKGVHAARIRTLRVADFALAAGE